MNLGLNLNIKVYQNFFSRISNIKRNSKRKKMFEFFFHIIETDNNFISNLISNLNFSENFISLFDIFIFQEIEL